MSEYTTKTSTNTGGGKSGVGVGSASIVLIFAVLCLTVFTLITYIVANNHKSLVDAEVDLVAGYYAADATAERVMDWLFATGETSGLPEGIEVKTSYNEDYGAETTYFYCPVNDLKALYINVFIEEGSYEIISWRMVDLDDWEIDNTINIWDGS